MVIKYKYQNLPLLTNLHLPVWFSKLYFLCRWCCVRKHESICISIKDYQQIMHLQQTTEREDFWNPFSTPSSRYKAQTLYYITKAPSLSCSCLLFQMLIFRIMVERSRFLSTFYIYIIYICFIYILYIYL